MIPYRNATIKRVEHERPRRLRRQQLRPVPLVRITNTDEVEEARDGVAIVAEGPLIQPPPVRRPKKLLRVRQPSVGAGANRESARAVSSSRRVGPTRLLSLRFAHLVTSGGRKRCPHEPTGFICEIGNFLQFCFGYWLPHLALRSKDRDMLFAFRLLCRKKRFECRRPSCRPLVRSSALLPRLGSQQWGQSGVTRRSASSEPSATCPCTLHNIALWCSPGRQHLSII